jgi:hypothetical protein
MALALTKLAAFSSEAPQTALEYALRGVEGAEASASDSELRLLATALDDLLAAVKESHASDEHRLALPPRLPPYAAIDRLLDGEPVRDAVNAERIVRSFRDSDGTTGSAKLAYLDGVILDRLGRHREAGEKLKVSVALEESRPEPLLALAQSLCAAGESASAAAVLRSALEGSQAGHRSIWDLWASVSFAHLRKTPVELLQDFPRAPAASYGGDLRWLLERLAADEPVRIRCGGEEHRTPDGAVFGKDRFFTGGNPAGPFDVEIAGMADAPLYLCERWFPADEMGSAGYRIPLPPGRYRVTLHFAEVWWYAPGLRKFDAVIEGRKVLEDYDPFAAGFATAEEKTWEVSIEDGLLEIEFLHKVNNPKVSAIEIERLD